MLACQSKKIERWIMDNKERQTVVTIGFFDGVHQGHRFLIQQVLEAARCDNLCSVVMTFDHHPREVLYPDARMELLTTLDEKLALLEATGIDRVEVLPFTREVSELSARDFMAQVLRDKLNARKLILGYDNRFGKRSANETFEDYVAYGRELGIEVVQAAMAPQGAVSSSRVRRALVAGDVSAANLLLGYSYALTGTVVGGHQEGRKLGFPTANLRVAGSRKLIPASGVYGVRVSIDGADHVGMMNIGTRPTFNGHEKTLEVNIFDYQGDLYGRELTVVFSRRIRDERRFDSPELLAEQLLKDKEEALRCANE